MDTKGKYWIILLSIAGVSCGGYRYSYLPSSSFEMDSGLISGIGLLNFEIHYDSAQGHSTIKLTSLNETKGLFDLNTSTTSDTHLVLTQVDEVGKILFVNQIDHPLFRSVEYLGEDGKFKRIVIVQGESSVLIRTPLSTRAVKFTLVEVIQGKEVSTHYFKR